MSNANYKPEHHHKAYCFCGSLVFALFYKHCSPQKAKLNSPDPVENMHSCPWQKWSALMLDKASKVTF